jgi:hypothetical protein
VAQVDRVKVFIKKFATTFIVKVKYFFLSKKNLTNNNMNNKLNLYFIKNILNLLKSYINKYLLIFNEILIQDLKLN